MALTDINLEEITPRTTLTRTNLALLRNELSSLDNAVEFGDVIKQLFALVQQSDLTGSSFETLAEASLLVQEARNLNNGDRFSDDDLMSTFNNISFDFLPSRRNEADLFLRPWNCIITGTTYSTIPVVASPTLELHSGADYTKDYGKTWIENPSLSAINHEGYLTHYQKSTEFFFIVGYSSVIVTSDPTGVWSSSMLLAGNYGLPLDGADNQKEYSATAPTDINDAQVIVFLASGINTSTTQRAYIKLSNEYSTFTLRDIETYSSHVMKSIAYSPTLDVFVTACDDGGNGCSYTVENTVPYLQIDTQYTELQGSKVRWVKDRFVVLDGNILRHSTDLNTWTTYTFPVGTVLNNVQQISAVYGEVDNVFPWHIILCNDGKLYLTKNWTDYYLKMVTENTDWYDITFIDAYTGIMIGSDGDAATVTIQ